MSEYGSMQSVGNHGLSGSIVGSTPAEVPPAGLLQQTRHNIAACHEMLSHLHKFADQYAGVRHDEKNATAPAPVPNGLAEELRDATGYLLTRVNMLCQRLAAL